ncbi:MAG: gamma-glutamylcyclotransferase family protein [Pseudomonadota bacterium]
MTSELFVYGTLLSTDTGALGRAPRARLQREAMLVGAAMIEGRLYHLGAYPALAPPRRRLDQVHGEVWRLHDADAALPWLDAYEGIAVADGPGEYERVLREVRVPARAETLQAWVYLSAQNLDAFPHLQDGRWRGA